MVFTQPFFVFLFQPGLYWPIDCLSLGIWFPAGIFHCTNHHYHQNPNTQFKLFLPTTSLYGINSTHHHLWDLDDFSHQPIWVISCFRSQFFNLTCNFLGKSIANTTSMQNQGNIHSEHTQLFDCQNNRVRNSLKCKFLFCFSRYFYFFFLSFNLIGWNWMEAAKEEWSAPLAVFCFSDFCSSNKLLAYPYFRCKLQYKFLKLKMGSFCHQDYVASSK